MTKKELMKMIKEAQQFAKENSGNDWQGLRKYNDNILSRIIRDGVVNHNGYDITLDIVPCWGNCYSNIINMDMSFLKEYSEGYSNPWEAPLKVVLVIENYETGMVETIESFDDDNISVIMEIINLFDSDSFTGMADVIDCIN